MTALSSRSPSDEASLAASGPGFQELFLDLGERSYSILVGKGLVADAGERMTPLLRQKRVVIITDENVAALHLERLEISLQAAGIRYDSLVLPAGEATKSFSQFASLCDDILGLGIDRKTMLVALGGGVIGDLAGYAAASLLRGIDFIQMPTSLLAQVDSSVGGKTGINSHHGKNLVGAFHQPRLVLADGDFLDTLPPRELRAGYAEVVKYGLIDDPEFFAWLEKNGPAVLAGNPEAQRFAVATSCAAKARVVAADEREAGQRALLNLGHTFGHAFEAECAYDGSLLHGEAVSIGMAMALDYSVACGLCPAEDALRAKSHMRASGLPVHPRDMGQTLDGHSFGIGPLPDRCLDPDLLLSHMAKDKKVLDSRLVFILLRGIGQSFVSRDVEAAALKTFLQGWLSAGSAAV